MFDSWSRQGQQLFRSQDRVNNFLSPSNTDACLAFVCTEHTMMIVHINNHMCTFQQEKI